MNKSTNKVEVMFDLKALEMGYSQYLDAYPEYRNCIRTDFFPVLHYDVYNRWKPSKLKAVFIAESPPWKELENYFYDQDSTNTLTRVLFQYLGITLETKRECLQEFKRRGFFLIDTIKCIFNKNRRSIPKSLIQWSAQQIIEPELRSLSPPITCALGETAFHGLGALEMYAPVLSQFQSITKVPPEAFTAGASALLVSPYPNDRNRPYADQIRRVFSILQDLVTKI